MVLLSGGAWALIRNHPDPDLAGTGAAKSYPSYHAAPNVDHSNNEVGQTAHWSVECEILVSVGTSHNEVGLAAHWNYVVWKLHTTHVGMDGSAV